MLIEQLIRLGRPFLKGGFTPAEILGMVSDVLDPGARNFFTKVILVEVDRTETGQVAVRWERWGVFRKDESETNEVFSPSQKQVVAVPFTIPSGGNPLHAQGRYGVPVYLIYEKNAQAMIHHLDETLKYLKARLERTPGVQLTEQEFHSVGQAVHEVIRKIELPKKKKNGSVCSYWHWWNPTATFGMNPSLIPPETVLRRCWGQVKSIPDVNWFLIWSGFWSGFGSRNSSRAKKRGGWKVRVPSVPSADTKGKWFRLTPKPGAG